MDKESPLQPFLKQLFTFWHNAAILPALGIPGAVDMDKHLMKLLSLLEQGNLEEELPADLDQAGWGIRNTMLDAMDTIEGHLGLPVVNTMATNGTCSSRSQRPPWAPCAPVVSQTPNCPVTASAFSHNASATTSLAVRAVEVTIAVSRLIEEAAARPRMGLSNLSDAMADHAAAMERAYSARNTVIQHGSLVGTWRPLTQCRQAAPPPIAPWDKAPQPSLDAVMPVLRKEYFGAPHEDLAHAQKTVLELFDTVRRIVPVGSFSYEGRGSNGSNGSNNSVYSNSFFDNDKGTEHLGRVLPPLVCVAAGWGLGSKSYRLPEGLLSTVTYCQISNLLVLAGDKLRRVPGVTLPSSITAPFPVESTPRTCPVGCPCGNTRIPPPTPRYNAAANPGHPQPWMNGSMLGRPQIGQVPRCLVGGATKPPPPKLAAVYVRPHRSSSDSEASSSEDSSSSNSSSSSSETEMSRKNRRKKKQQKHKRSQRKKSKNQSEFSDSDSGDSSDASDASDGSASSSNSDWVDGMNSDSDASSSASSAVYLSDKKKSKTKNAKGKKGVFMKKEKKKMASGGSDSESTDADSGDHSTTDYDSDYLEECEETLKRYKAKHAQKKEKGVESRGKKSGFIVVKK